MFGGGRASILFLTLMQICVYSLMPIVFLYNLDVMIQDELEEVGISVGRLESTLILLTISLLFIPVILIREFNRIKVLGILVFLGNLLIIVEALVFCIWENVPVHVTSLDPVSRPHDY